MPPWTQAALDRLSRQVFEPLCDGTRCSMAELMSEPGINQLTHFALFLPFSCIDKRQSATNRSKTETAEVIDKMKETGLYG